MKDDFEQFEENIQTQKRLREFMDKIFEGKGIQQVLEHFMFIIYKLETRIEHLEDEGIYD